MFSIEAAANRRHVIAPKSETGGTCTLPASSQVKEHPFSTMVKADSRFLFGASKSVFQACMDFASCQRLLETTKLFEFIFFLLNPTILQPQLTRQNNKRVVNKGCETFKIKY